MLLDFRFAVRVLTRNPGFALAAITTLALGIGANTAMFTVAYEVLLRPLPYAASDRIVRVWESWGGNINVIAPANYADWRERSRSFAQTAAFVAGAANLSGTGDAERIQTAHVTGTFFDVLRLGAIHGRTLTTADETASARTVVVRESFWRTRLGASPDLPGRTLVLDGVTYEVVGVLPDAVDQPSRDTQVWRPLTIPPSQLKTRGAHYLSVIGRLNDGISIRQADDELRAIAAELSKQYPDTNARVSATVVSLREDATRGSRTGVLVLFGATAALLLLACVNVAHLLLARGAAREGELAVRAAIGASRPRLVRQLLSESVLLATVGAGAGLLIAMWATLAVRGMVPDAFADARRAEVNVQAFGFAAAATLATILLFGLLPALRQSRTSLAGASRALGAQVTRRSGFGRPLIVLQVALAVVLVIGAGLLVNTMLNLHRQVPPFATADLVAGRIALPSTKYPTGAAQRTFFRELIERLEASGGIERAAVATRLPLRPQAAQMTFTVDTAPHRSVDGAIVQEMSPGLLDVLGIPLAGGRSFDEADSATSSVAMVSRRFAQMTWGTEDVVGRRLRMGPTYIDEGLPWLTVVGVVEDVAQLSLTRRPAPQVYLPYGQPSTSWAASEIIVRTSSSPDRAFAAIRATVRSMDTAQPVSALTTMAGAVDRTLAQPRFMALLTTTFAGLALLLAVVGIYGIVSYAVARRSREIGVRVALGATRTDVLRLIGIDGIGLVALGLLAGLAGAAILSRGLESIVFGLGTLDVRTYLAGCGIIFGAALLACLVPALRATRVDPVTALRAP